MRARLAGIPSLHATGGSRRTPDCLAEPRARAAVDGLASLVGRPLSYQASTGPDVGRGVMPAVRAVSSTLLATSFHTLCRHGWAERYFQALPPPLHRQLRLFPAGTWAPVRLAVAHYCACGQMGLTATETAGLSLEVARSTHALAGGIEGARDPRTTAKPWDLLSRNGGGWHSLFQGGKQSIRYVGPDGAVILMDGLPLLAIPFFRAALLAHYTDLTGLPPEAIRASAVPGTQSESQATFRLSWMP